MPGAYVSGIAKGQAGVNQNHDPYSPQFQNAQPWNTPTFDANMTAQLGNGSYLNVNNNKPLDANAKVSQTWLNANNGGEGGVFYGNGAQGWGVYRTKTLPQQQQYFTNQFEQDMPQMRAQMGSQLSQSVNQGMGAGLENARQSNSNRGLLYGGIGAGNEQRVRAAAQSQLAQGQSDINQGLIDSYNKMASSTINTAISYQQMQQSIQNSIYQNAMAKTQAGNQTFNNVASTAAMAAVLL